ncbi:extracellular superoxide dismutase [Cu-Zn] isoform X1 [Lagopus muta]|uniref:extracellular superoxide dismutase [Cu-Zn] isoform X1 n=2 Tax=Lagopus muta TaxID=64668 RepID=UPI00209D0A02|nr:extracellular superoxide dismutase [Cu-Zn] isoform X1 [Lagopus muta]
MKKWKHKPLVTTSATKAPSPAPMLLAVQKGAQLHTPMDTEGKVALTLGNFFSLCFGQFPPQAQRARTSSSACPRQTLGSLCPSHSTAGDPSPARRYPTHKQRSRSHRPHAAPVVSDPTSPQGSGDAGLVPSSAAGRFCRLSVARMLLLLSLVTGLALSASGVMTETGADPSCASLHDVQRKVNDLWQSLLYPVMADNETDGLTYATCEMKPSSKIDVDKPQVTGQVLFRQHYSQGRLEAIFHLDGFPLDNNQSGRAIHIHELGDLSNGCDSTGGHYNPFRVNHPRHPGDFGNFSPKDGKIRKYKSNLFATMFGPYSILGRSVVIHEQEDDMGKGNNKASLENGNAGKRLACCVIGICNKNLWEEKQFEATDKKKRWLRTRLS